MRRELLVWGAGAAAIQSVGIGRGLYNDEYLTWYAVSMDWGAMVENRLAAGHLPTWFAVTKAWVAMAGDAEWALRAPAAACAVGAVVAMRALVGRLVADVAVARWAAGLMMIHQLVLWSGQSARPYAAMLLGLVLCWLGVAMGGRRGGALAAVAAGGAGAMHLLALGPLAGLSVALALLRRWRMAAGVAAGGLVPVLVRLMVGGGGDGDGPRLQWVDPMRVFTSIGHAALGDGRHLVGGDVPMVVQWALLAALMVGWWRWRPERPVTAMVAGWLAGGWLTLVAGQALGGGVLGHARYFTPVVPAVVVLAAGGLAGLGERWRAGVALALVVAMAMMAGAWLVQRGDGARDVAQAMGAPVYAGGPAIPLLYEFRRTPTQLHVTGLEDEAAMWRFVEALGGGIDSFWLMAYDNRPLPGDRWLGESLPGWRITRREESGWARAALWERRRAE